MRRLIGAIVVVAVIVGIGFLGFFLNIGIANNVREKLILSAESMQQNQPSESRRIFQQAAEDWHNGMETMLLFVSHGKIDEIDKTMHKANAYLEIGQFDLYYSECSLAQLLLEHYMDTEYPYVNNIF